MFEKSSEYFMNLEPGFNQFCMKFPINFNSLFIKVNWKI